jgi:hypothetical protein
VLRYNRRSGRKERNVTDLTRKEQEDGAAVIRRWPKHDIQTVVKLPARERDIIVLAAGLLDLRPVNE